MTTASRAPKGGTTGKNGLYYAGGTFLPTTNLDKLTRRNSVKTPTRRVQVGPNDWQVAPEGMFAAFSIIGTTAAFIDGRMAPFAKGIAYYGETRNGWSVSEICEAWNNGERFLPKR